MRRDKMSKRVDSKVHIFVFRYKQSDEQKGEMIIKHVFQKGGRVEFQVSTRPPSFKGDID